MTKATGKLLILQFRTDVSLEHERECLVNSGGFDRADLHFANVLGASNKLPNPNDLADYSGIIMGGSGQVDISRWDDETKTKIARIGGLVKEAIKRDMPMLSICFGHQLVAYFIGGRVEADYKQAETGTYRICLNHDGKKCPLFTGIPEQFYAVLGHKDSVVKLPTGAIPLASSDKCRFESYRINNNIFCVQFHPELDKEGLRQRLNLFPSYAQGNNAEKILNGYKETKFASIVMTNFKKLIERNCGE